MSAGPPVVAVDIGATKFEAALVEADGRLGPRHRADTSDAASAEELAERLVSVAQAAAGDGDGSAVRVGVGTAGPFLVAGRTIAPVNLPLWDGFDVRACLQGALGLDTVVAGDAQALAMGEGWLGAARGIDNFVAMVVSTGIGGGLVVDGRLLRGALGNAGHLGHVIVEPDGRPCPCGGRGCVEAEASGTALRAILGSDPAEAPLELRRRTGTLVGRAVASVVATLDVPLALVAGGVALGFGDDFFDAAQAELSARARLTFARDARIVPAGLGDTGPLIGAAALAFNP
ncbi:MAG: ROK family protein [Microthrixaceae bacterium]|nr:ROK family protein [Microthrixaceae bacterium]